VTILQLYPRCPYCHLHPYSEPGVQVAVECCPYGQLLYGNGIPKGTVDQIFLEEQGYPPPYKDPSLDNRSYDHE
jgi:hypothetical protein